MRAIALSALLLGCAEQGRTAELEQELAASEAEVARLTADLSKARADLDQAIEIADRYLEKDAEHEEAIERACSGETMIVCGGPAPSGTVLSAEQL